MGQMRLGESSPERPRPMAPMWEREGTLYVIGVDGLTLDVAGPLMERGELPNLSRLAREGCCGPLATVEPTNSSLIWTSIATGCHHRLHGIDGFQRYRLLGLPVSRTLVRRFKKLGGKGVLRFLTMLHLMREYVFDCRSVRAKRFWEIVSLSGGRVGVVNWWHSWPAQPVDGFIVSDRLHYWRGLAQGTVPDEHSRLTFPENLLAECSNLVVPPQEIGVEQMRRFVNLPAQELQEFVEAEFEHHELRGELRFLISADLTYSRVLQHCLDLQDGLRLVAFYCRGPDIAQHCAFHYRPELNVPGVGDREREKFGGVVDAAYRFADHIIGDVLERTTPNDTVLVVSDHGFGLQPVWHTYGHRRGRYPGVIYAWGKEFRQGWRVADASVYDVAPTVLRLCGLPAAADMQGRSLEELLTDQFREAHPLPEAVKSYGPREDDHRPVADSRDATEQMKEHLRALGYLD